MQAHPEKRDMTFQQILQPDCIGYIEIFVPQPKENVMTSQTSSTFTWSELTNQQFLRFAYGE